MTLRAFRGCRYRQGTDMVGWTMGRPSSNRARDAQMIEALCDWFDVHKRDLPWRRRRTGYRALVAEAMLQQTQAARVVGRFEKFIERFPTVRALADADEQDVLAMWQGLGYYRRAQHLRNAARMIVTQFGGRVPSTVKRLRQLPGVGRYSAAAIASIVYRKAEPMVDGNVRRVLARWEAQAGATGDDWAWDRSADLVNAASAPGTLNEALMELGALICTPRAPQCERCPVVRHCKAFARCAQNRIPLPKRATRQKVEHHHAVVIVRGGKMLLERRTSKGMWSQMWQAPTIETTKPLRDETVEAALPVRVDRLTKRGRFKHQTTHRRITFHVYTARSRARRGVWRHFENIDELPMSNAQRRVLAVAGVGSHYAEAVSAVDALSASGSDDFAVG